MELALRSPDHTTLSRRGQHLDLTLRGVPRRAGLHLIIDSTGLSIVGEGEWAAAKHGGPGKRGWKKLHVGVDRSGVIVARALTDATVDDATRGIELIEAVNDDITSVTADTAYDTVGFYEAARARAATVVVPPAKTARVSHRRPRSSARDRTVNRRRASDDDSGTRRHATINKRESRTRSSGISRSSARVFEPGHPVGERSKRCLGATY